jgi:hypothetical protein
VLRLVDSAAALFLLLSGICCHGRGPSTRSMVYNLSMSAFDVEGQQVEVGFSQSVNTAHGVTDTVELKRGAVAARLVITSLVAAGDPNQYDAAIGWPWTAAPTPRASTKSSPTPETTRTTTHLR